MGRRMITLIPAVAQLGVKLMVGARRASLRAALALPATAYAHVGAPAKAGKR